MQLMVEGDKFELYIPSELGYGDAGSPPKIPGGSVLIFQMEILEIQGDSVPALSCDAATSENCSDKETAYILKTKTWDEAKVPKEVERLQGMLQGSMKPELKEWISRRLHILNQLTAKKEDEL